MWRVFEVDWFEEVLGPTIMALALGGWILVAVAIAEGVSEPSHWYNWVFLGVLLAVPGFALGMIILQAILALLAYLIERVKEALRRDYEARRWKPPQSRGWKPPQSMGRREVHETISLSSGRVALGNPGSDPFSCGYDANSNGPYGRTGGAGIDYASSWYGPNEPGGSLDI